MLPVYLGTPKSGMRALQNKDLRRKSGGALNSGKDTRAVCIPQTNGQASKRYSTGIVKKNVDPSPNWDSTQIRPPWRSMIRLTNASPMPVPS